MTSDLMLRGVRVIDPSQQLDSVIDVGRVEDRVGRRGDRRPLVAREGLQHLQNRLRRLRRIERAA
jgi:hypothetical protein